MEFLIEELLDLLLEGSIEISANKKISKWIRYPLIVIIVLLFLIAFAFFCALGLALLSENIFAGIFMFAIIILFVILGVKKFKKIYLKREDDNKKI